MAQYNTPTGKFVKFADWWDADMYAKTWIKDYWVTDQLVNLVEKLRWQDKLDPSYPDNYNYNKLQEWQWPQNYETSKFASTDWAWYDQRLRSQYRQHGTWEFYTMWKNWEVVKNTITRTPKWANITPKNPASQLDRLKSQIRKWVNRWVKKTVANKISKISL